MSTNQEPQNLREARGDTGLIRAAEVDLPAVTKKFTVVLPQWTGPYDLLLQVIQEQDLNLFDLNISILLDHYLQYLEQLESIDIDEAGEFVVVAATLAQIKSKMLLPVDPNEKNEEEEGDPRAELVRYLIEYQKIKQAADQLRARPLLGRDVFVKGAQEVFEGLETEGHGKLFQLVKGFQKALARADIQLPFEVEMEDVSVSDRFQEVFSRVQTSREVCFEDFLPIGRSKSYLIASFLAVLELVRMKKVLILQRIIDGPLFLIYREGATSEDVVHSEFDEVLDLESPSEEVEQAVSEVMHES